MDSQPTLFGSVPSVAGALFSEDDRYRLFARKVWPVLAGTRAALEKCYCPDNGRPGVEPVLLMGVLVLQFLERLPDRQALEMVKYHLGWKLALNLELEQKAFHPTVLCYFRQRLVENEIAGTAFRAVLDALQEEGLVAKRTRQRLDSTHVIGLVAVTGGFRQQLCWRRGIIPQEPSVRLWGVIIEQVLNPSLKSPPNVIRRYIVTTFDDRFRTRANRFARIGNPDEVQFDPIAMLLGILEKLHVGTPTECRFERERFMSIY